MAPLVAVVEEENTVVSVDFIPNTPSPPPYGPASTLEEAIQNLSVGRLRGFVISLCQEQATVAEYLEKQLMTKTISVHDGNGSTVGQKDNNDAWTTNGEKDRDLESEEKTRKRKREEKPGNIMDIANLVEEKEVIGDIKSADATLKNVRSRYALCVKCKQEYDITVKAEGECLWHPGDLSLDEESDTWEKWHGATGSRLPYGDDDAMKQYPEGFIWDCCNGNGTVKHCKTGTHVEWLDQGRPRKRSR